MSDIHSALEKLFQTHRIVFWYDDSGEMQAEFEQLALPGVVKLTLENNAFGLKHRILRQDFKSKYLLYSPAAQPAYLDNWLLDVQLANAVFSADKFSMWLAELGLPPAFLDFVKTHAAFFESTSRRKSLKGRGLQELSMQELTLKMMAVCTGSAVEDDLESILMALFNSLAQSDLDLYQRLARFGLLEALWQALSKAYDYRPETAHIKDFALSLFEAAYLAALGKEHNLNQEAVLLLNRWKDSLKHRPSFETLSSQFSELLDIPQDLQHYPIDDLLGVDIFAAVDQRILELLMEALLKGTLQEDTCREITRRRGATHWYSSHFEPMYQALLSACSLLNRLKNLAFTIESVPDGMRKYISSWYQVDQYYRQFIYLMRQSNQPAFFKELAELIEKQYSNNFLRPLNDNWQSVVDQVAQWENHTLSMQGDFYEQAVEPVLRNNIKLAVIISDGLRYELGEELANRIEREGRFTAEIDAMLGQLPSYTQLGMAALLPHQSLEIQGDGSVLVDGFSSQGLENRGKILSRSLPGKSRALLDSELKAMTSDERRTLFRENQLAYVYHNQIDVAADKLNEERLFEAAESSMEELVNLVKMLRNANFTRILVTADHGFLYQYQALQESDFLSAEVEDRPCFTRNRRFMVGQGLQPNPGMRLFSAAELGLRGDYQALITNSIHRLRVKGAGSRYVHGGASLQEIVIPLVVISLERGEEASVRSVKIDKISSASNKITTGQVSVAFYQVEPVSAKVLPRRLRAGIYAEDGKLISNLHVLQFSFESENPRDREIVINFQLSAEADRYNRQRVFVRLEEVIPDTEKYRLYAEWLYQLDKAHFAFF